MLSCMVAEHDTSIMYHDYLHEHCMRIHKEECTLQLVRSENGYQQASYVNHKLITGVATHAGLIYSSGVCTTVAVYSVSAV